MKIYFLSDAHLGYPTYQESLKREKKIVHWLEEVSKDADEIWLLGDVFEFWFEWKRVVPKGFLRVLGKICELTDNGLPIHFYTGNHDLWVFDYLHHETGMILHKQPVIKEYNGKKFYIAHGDGLGDYDKKFNAMKVFFTSRFFQRALSLFHPNLTMKVAHAWAGSSKYNKAGVPYFGDDKEWLMLYSKEVLQKQHIDYFVYGHRHLAFYKELNDKSHCVNLGEWINLFTYGEFDGEKMLLKEYNEL
jgi:UDP-2,3-diacylglucosamine hydrolase